jgi:hypothetical protein
MGKDQPTGGEESGREGRIFIFWGAGGKPEWRIPEKITVPAASCVSPAIWLYFFLTNPFLYVDCILL